MLQANIIRPSNSLILMIPKADGGHRFCVDYRKLNKVTIPDKFPMPRIDDIFDKLQGSEWFSEIDLNSAFWLLSIKKSDIDKTAFSTPDGHYEFLRMPFGVTNGTHAFQRLMFIIFGENSNFIQTYLHNLIVHSDNSVTNHFQFLQYFLIKQEKLI